MMVSILGCGWFGLALAKELVAKGVAVNGSTTSSAKLDTLSGAGIYPFLIDLAEDAHTYNNDFFKCDILVIAVPPKSRSGEGAEYVPKLQRVIQAINQNKVKKVIFISSTGVYADLNQEVTEQADPQSDTPSGKILFSAETLFREQAGFKATIIRFGGLVGPGRDPGRFFAGKTGIPNGLAPVNMIEQSDCTGIVQAIIEQDAFGYTFNACAPHHPTKIEFYGQAAAKANLPQAEFISELKEWKLVNSSNVPQILGYRYQTANWDNWFK